VVVQDRATLIPLLPKSVAEARVNFDRTKQDIDASVKDLETELKELRKSWKDVKELRIPPAHYLEVRYLAEVMSDEAYLAQEQSVLDLWNTWQTELVELGVKGGSEGQIITQGMRLLETQHHEWRVPIRVKAGEGHGGGCFFCEQKATATTYSFLSVQGFDYERPSELMKAARGLAEARLPAIARAWNPLAMDLRDEAEELLDQEQTRIRTSDPDLQSLRILARIDLLERVRYALWLDLLMWSHLAGRPLPRPPAKMDEAR
jgi:hypothetical protein